MACKDTRNTLLRAARRIILTKGFAATGLSEILAAAGVPKGSFYHYFKSKEDFGAELLKCYLEEQEAFIRQCLTITSMDPLERIMLFMEKSRALLERNQCRQSCLIAKLGAEVSDLSESMRNVQRDGVRKWLDVYAECVREGQQAGSINRNLDASQAAALIHDLWQGASVRMQIDQDTAPLENASLIIRRMLTPH